MKANVYAMLFVALLCSHAVLQASAQLPDLGGGGGGGGDPRGGGGLLGGLLDIILPVLPIGGIKNGKQAIDFLCVVLERVGVHTTESPSLSLIGTVLNPFCKGTKRMPICP
jgi:hypothetical protein